MAYILVQYKHDDDDDDDDSVGKLQLGNHRHRCTDGCLGYSAGIKHCCQSKQVILLVHKLLLSAIYSQRIKAKVFVSIINRRYWYD